MYVLVYVLGSLLDKKQVTYSLQKNMRYVIVTQIGVFPFIYTALVKQPAFLLRLKNGWVPKEHIRVAAVLNTRVTTVVIMVVTDINLPENHIAY